MVRTIALEMALYVTYLIVGLLVSSWFSRVFSYGPTDM